MTEAATGFTFMEAAVIRKRGGEIEEDDTVRGAAWRVYNWIRAKAYSQERDNSYRHEDMDGFRWIGNYEEPFRDLWTAGASPLPGIPVDVARRTVWDHLMNSGNIVILERGGPRTPSLWWGKQDYDGYIPEEVTDVTGEEPSAGAEAPEPEPEPESEEDTFPCRETDCWAKPFISSAARSSHENTYHANSKWRVYACPLRTVCGGAAFYEWSGLAIHISRQHGISRTKKEFPAVRQAAEDEAAARLRILAPARPVPVSDTWEEPSTGKAPVIIPHFSKSGPPENGVAEAAAAMKIMHSLPPATRPAPQARPDPPAPDFSGSFGDLQAFIRNMQGEFARLQQRNAELEAQAARGTDTARLREAVRLIKAAAAILEEGISDS